jgi:hypothetical protein
MSEGVNGPGNTFHDKLLDNLVGSWTLWEPDSSSWRLILRQENADGAWRIFAEKKLIRDQR